ncbi:hypothetical protein C8R43DRAFT_1102778 [Mycena crocata]|nr:hypothetical protein C8R43DRAFT_1102778 [Mycena crocata]
MNVALADTASSGELSGGVRDERHEESILDDTVEPAARTDLDSDPAVAARAAIKRRPGRPKGSLDKNKTPKPGTDEQPKTRGRPRGTGPRQLEKARAASMGAIPAAFPAPLESEPKRPVGRPRKMPPPRAFSVYMGQRIVRGMPAVIRTRAAAEPNENNPNNLHPMFLPPGREHETASTPAVTANPPQLHSQPIPRTTSFPLMMTRTPIPVS